MRFLIKRLTFSCASNCSRSLFHHNAMNSFEVLTATYLCFFFKGGHSRWIHLSPGTLARYVWRLAEFTATRRIWTGLMDSSLAEVGRLNTPKNQGKYDTGQLFLHRVFGYRGVVLFPWLARVYDRDIPNKRERSIEDTSNVSKEVKGSTHTFYQVLIDSRDCPHIRAQTEAVTFLGNQESSRSLYAIPGLDYVAHEDILPYTTTEKQPLQHELFDKFLVYTNDKDPPFAAQETLRAWQKKNHPWLELSDVHKETTENVRITVIPFYMGCRDSQTSSVYWWRYCIRLENLGDLTVQLRERHWRIFSLSGTLETVRGRGVVGQEPILSKSLPAFQYSSHVSLQAPSGHMWGTFRMEREDGYTFDCRIPPFSLESKNDEANPSGFI